MKSDPQNSANRSVGKKDVNLIFIDPIAKNTDKFNGQPAELSSF